MTRSLLPGLLLPLLLSAADSRIDHATLAGKDLKALQAKLASVGINYGVWRSAQQSRDGNVDSQFS